MIWIVSRGKKLMLTLQSTGRMCEIVLRSSLSLLNYYSPPTIFYCLLTARPAEVIWSIRKMMGIFQVIMQSAFLPTSLDGVTKTFCVLALRGLPITPPKFLRV